MRTSLCCYLIVVAACVAGPANRRPFTGVLPSHTSLDMSGSFTFSLGGQLRLALTRPCKYQYWPADRTRSPEINPCQQIVLDRIKVVAHTPWNQDIHGSWDGADLLTFDVDWKATGLDPFAEDVGAIVARPWSISGTEWNPTPEQAGMILKHIVDAADVESQVVRGGPVPSLEVTTFEVAGGTLHKVDPNALVVRIKNRGPGTAYRVDATTRSSIESLHGSRLSFGMLKPGVEKERRLTLTIPASEVASDTMLVLVLSEANGVVPPNIGHRIPIAPSAAAPELAVSCRLIDHDAPQPELDRGQNLVLRCLVVNSGNADAKQVEVGASIARSPVVHSVIQSIPATKRALFDLSIMIPRDLPIGAPVEIAIAANDRSSSRSARTTLGGVIGKPRLCVVGQLTRPQYQAKLAELRAAVAARDLTQAQFDRYDLELVACLK